VAIARAAIDWFAVNGRDLPWRNPDFTPWGSLVSEFMLQQTPVNRVLPKLAEWLERWPTPADLAGASPGDAVRAWDRLGYPRRALNLHATAVAIVERHGGVVPSDVPALLALPGIGDYTARAISVFAYGKRHPVVDVNIRRVIARAVHGLPQPGNAAKRDLDDMEALLPESDDEARLANAAIMELGALVCVARTPRCGECPIAAECAWRAAGYPDTTEPGARKQARYEGSDRQARGVVLAELRASDIPVRRAELEWPDEVQLDRAIASLLHDGLMIDTEAGFALPEMAENVTPNEGRAIE
jgi:A/G-specific adenine glycosylase